MATTFSRRDLSRGGAGTALITTALVPTMSACDLLSTTPEGAPTQGYGIVANDVHNVPASMPDANSYATPGPTNPEQYFIEPG